MSRESAFHLNGNLRKRREQRGKNGRLSGKKSNDSLIIPSLHTGGVADSISAAPTNKIKGLDEMKGGAENGKCLSV